MTIKDYVAQTLDTLSEGDLQDLAEYVAFLRFRSRVHTPAFNMDQVAALYKDFAEEDRQLAEAGMADYSASLRTEDERC